ncbi:hypothetical protein TI39_contig5947g00001 [Zymoseptoria brevis]|uniref:Uncharacterized protein n=1 Tax=Zymoseptoria brevis TaxID=1047168 RepID=A0A0F4G728_9PEZI|nr:hypothetical protein TI39_contig5947g00001 [Zymoseptoria brevis]
MKGFAITATLSLLVASGWAKPKFVVKKLDSVAMQSSKSGLRGLRRRDNRNEFRWNPDGTANCTDNSHCTNWSRDAVGGCYGSTPHADLCNGHLGLCIAVSTDPAAFCLCRIGEPTVDACHRGPSPSDITGLGQAFTYCVQNCVDDSNVPNAADHGGNGLCALADNPVDEDPCLGS